MTTAELGGHRIGWFLLACADHEVEQIVESARRHGIIVPLAEPSTSDPALPRWIAAEAGRKLPFPRNTAPGDLSAHLPSALERVRALVTGWSAAALAVIAAAGVGAGVVTSQIAIAGGIAAVVALVAAAGVRAERDLQAAAHAWPRLKAERPNRWRWQTMPGRSEVTAVGTFSAISLVLLAWILGLDSVAGKACTVAGAAVAVITALIYLCRIRPVSKAWRDEVGLSSKWSRRGRSLKGRVGGLKPVASWVFRGY
jgi:hypothetical protein